MPETIIYKPRGRVLFDLLLIVNVFLIVIYPLRIIPEFILIVVAMSVNSVMILFWFLVVKHFFRIKLQSNAISGPTDKFFRSSILLRKVDHIRSREHSQLEQWLGIYNIWSFEGTCVRVYRKLLGHGPTNKILSIVENYPLRESHGEEPPEPS